MSDPYGNYVERVVFMFGENSNPEIAQSHIESISKMFTEQFGLAGESVEACIGEEPDMVTVNLFGIEQYVDTNGLCAFLAEQASVFGSNQPEVKIYPRIMARRLQDLKYM